MRQALIVVAAVLLLRLPFLNQAIQGDDIYYLAGAAHAQIDPLHPTHARYVFMGDLVDMRGHSHPPLNAWVLGALVAIFGGVREIPFHAAYVVFSLIAALSVLALARRFSPRPVCAVLLFLATPAFVVNGNSLEADLPFLAFWLASLALVRPLADARGSVSNLKAESAWAIIPMALAALTAFQTVFLTPILLLHAWLYARRSKLAWALAFTPVAVIGAWQLFELASTGRLPASVLTGYFSAYGFQALEQKLRNAAMLGIHSLWILFPPLLVAAVWAAWKRRGRDTLFLAGWIAIFFAGAVVVFFAGSARYLLPVAAPLALLASWARPRWLAVGFACQMALAIGLAVVNYDHWNGYRHFAASLKDQGAGHRVWVNGEWGLQFYLEADGGLPLLQGQPVRPGDTVVSSALAYPVAFTTGGGALAPVSERDIGARLPLRLIGLDSHSGYSTASKGFLPFGFSRGPIDRVRAEIVVERKPASTYLAMGSPEAGQQIVSGLYQVEEGRWRWASDRAVVLLKSPSQPSLLRVVLAIPDMAPGRSITVLADDQAVASARFPAPGLRTIDSAPFRPRGESVTVAVVIDRTFSVPGDRRKLGFVLSAVGFIDAAGGVTPAP